MLAKEYVYYNQTDIPFPLSPEIEVVKTAEAETSFLVSNSPEIKALTYAPEINFYLSNSEDSLLEQSKNLTTLYEARALAIDFAKDMDFEQEVGKNVLLVGKEYDLLSLKERLKTDNFSTLILNEDDVKYIEGHLGNLSVGFLHEDEVVSVDTDHILWMNAPEEALKQSGVIDTYKKSEEEILKELHEKSGTHTYKNFITYDPSICQYHERREDVCGKCADVCPTVAIVKEEESKTLTFSHIDCHGCGGCISVCPSGAVDYAQMPRSAFSEIAKLYTDKTALIIPKKMELDSLHVKLPQNILPLAIEGEKYLHEAHLLTLLQESGSSVIFYTDFISKGTGDVISILNQAYQIKYGCDAIHVAMNEEELKEALEKAQPIENSSFSINEDGMRKREIFSARLSHMVGDENLGVIKTGEYVKYAEVKINANNCTLCLSCVGACNVRALTAHPEDNSLRLNSSICTSCGYCVLTCPEDNCMEIIEGEIKLESDFFKQKIVAQDTLFKCVECGKEFATTKSIERIANMMSPLFAGDDAKVRSLYCCADCKPKMMFQQHVNQMQGVDK